MARLPLKPGQPLDRALIQATREAALDELKDHGYPYATVRLAEEPGIGGAPARAEAHRRTGRHRAITVRSRFRATRASAIRSSAGS